MHKRAYPEPIASLMPAGSGANDPAAPASPTPSKRARVSVDALPTPPDSNRRGRTGLDHSRSANAPDPVAGSLMPKFQAARTHAPASSAIPHATSNPLPGLSDSTSGPKTCPIVTTDHRGLSEANVKLEAMGTGLFGAPAQVHKEPASTGQPAQRGSLPATKPLEPAFQASPRLAPLSSTLNHSSALPLFTAAPSSHPPAPAPSPSVVFAVAPLPNAPPRFPPPNPSSISPAPLATLEISTSNPPAPTRPASWTHPHARPNPPSSSSRTSQHPPPQASTSSQASPSARPRQITYTAPVQAPPSLAPPSRPPPDARAEDARPVVRSGQAYARTTQP